MSESLDRPLLLSHLEQARIEVLEWLRSNSATASALESATSAKLATDNTALVEAFLVAIETSGFELEVVNVGSADQPAFDPRWTHLDNDFVGFKQPPSGTTPDEAKLLGCAALLRNEWCRARLPGGQGTSPTASV